MPWLVLSNRCWLTCRAIRNCHYMPITIMSIEDEITQRIKGHFTHWHPIAGLSDEVLAEKIRADSIDILIDLSGHTARNRYWPLPENRRRYRPVGWLPGNHRVACHGLLFCRSFFLPPGQFDDQFTEKIVHLPACAIFTEKMRHRSMRCLP